MVLFRKIIVINLLFVLIPAGKAFAQTEITEVPNGKVYKTIMRDESYLFDRAEYAVFIPADIRYIKGVFIHQHGCTMEGIGYSTAYDIQYQAFAEKWGLAVVGPDIYPKEKRGCRDWIDTETGSGDALIKMLKEVGKLSGHDELTTAPWLLWGHSGGGYWTLSMMRNYPERIIGVFSYSPAFNPPWDFPEAASKIPLMIRHAGENDLNSPRVDCWGTALNVFSKLRKDNGLVSLAYNPAQDHNYSYVRYMAIPFYEAILSQRLPKGNSQLLNNMDASKAWLGDTTDYKIYKAATYKGNKAAMAWLPDSVTAEKWREYVITGTVADRTAPPTPYDFSIQHVNDSTMKLTWKADADIESGIKYFNIRFKDGKTIRFPDTDDYQRLDTNGDNTIPDMLPELSLSIPVEKENKVPVIFVSSVNHFGIESLLITTKICTFASSNNPKNEL